MKKVFVSFFLVLVMGCWFFLAGCGNGDDKNTKIITKVQNSDSEDEYYDEKDPIVLEEGARYILVAVKNKHIVVNSEEDFSNLKVAYIGGTDGEAYAKYYSFKEIGMYNAPNDLHSGIAGRDFDAGLIDEDKLSTYDDWEVVWEMEQ